MTARPVEQVDLGELRAYLIVLIIGGVFGSILPLGVALFRGRRQYRSLRAWLTFTTLVALWLGLAVSWRDLSWAGTRWRLAAQLEAFEPIATELGNHWPAQDGAVHGLGQFSAYPVGRPSTLLVIADDPTAARSPLAAVERSQQGALRFQLAGQETGAWLEWHPNGSEPATFTGGLENSRQLERSAQLAPQWFAVCYAPDYACIEQPPADGLTPAE